MSRLKLAVAVSVLILVLCALLLFSCFILYDNGGFFTLFEKWLAVIALWAAASGWFSYVVYQNLEGIDIGGEDD